MNTSGKACTPKDAEYSEPVAGASMPVVLDDSVPSGELRFMNGEARVNPGSNLHSVIKANPHVRFTILPDRESGGEGYERVTDGSGVDRGLA